MPTTLETLNANFENFVNGQAAEIEAVRAVLQSFLVSILANQPKGVELFRGLRDDTLKSLAPDSIDPPRIGDARKKAEFVHLRATQFFDEMAPVFGLKPAGSSEPRN